MHGTIGDRPTGWYNLAAGAPGDATLAFICSLVSDINVIRDSRESVQIGKFAFDFRRAMPVE